MNDDTISRQAAIEAIDSLVSTMSVCVSTDECRGMNWMKQRAIGAVEVLPSDPGWISCKERLPRYQEEVLISIGANGVGIGYLELDDNYSDISWVVADDDFYDGDEFELVEAWMPLPEPWRGEEK